MSELHALWINPEQAGQSFAQTVRPFCKEQWAQGKRLAVTIRELEDERTLKQLAFYWGPMLADISAQASIDGQKYVKDAWHELGKRLFLPRVTKKTKVAGKARPVFVTTIGTTKGLSVKRMSKYLDEFQAWAATEKGVVFSVDKWEDWRV